jgi:hypothetical protein
MKSFPLALVAVATLFIAQPASAELVHRWSFTTDAADSVGGAHGSLLGGAAVDGGRVHLDGVAAYVSLPIGGTIAGLDSATFETWVTWDAFQRVWARIFDFGTGPTEYMFLTPRNGRLDEGTTLDTPRFAITRTSTPEEYEINPTVAFPVGLETQVAITIDAATHFGSFYVNGALVATRPNLELLPSGLGTTLNNWLGRSQYPDPQDPYFDGSINKFRIYDAALSLEQVQQSFQLGPDQLVPEPSGIVVCIAAIASATAFRQRRVRSGF